MEEDDDENPIVIEVHGTGNMSRWNTTDGSQGPEIEAIEAQHITKAVDMAIKVDGIESYYF